MSDIFVSYASEDRTKAEAIVHAMESNGWSVWWDRKIPAGKRHHQVIAEALNEARCVVVLWSEISITKDWVLEEADEGRKRGALTQVRHVVTNSG